MSPASTLGRHVRSPSALETQTAAKPAQSPIVTLVFCGVAFILGTLMSLQARINGQLGIALDNRIQAALISFTVGLLALGILVAFVPSMKAGITRIPALLRARRLLPWHLMGGAAGACFILAQVYSVPLIGVALFTVVGVSAESVTALVIDRYGISPGGKYGLSVMRLAATALVLSAVILASVDKLNVLTISALALGAVFVARVGTTIQVTFNSKVAVTTESYLAATLVSFLVGATLLFIVFLIATLGGLPPSSELQPWWLYLGGIIGVLAVAGGTVCIPRVGVLLYGLSGVGGAIVGSLLIDLSVPFANAGVTSLTVAGSALALVGIVAATEPFTHMDPGRVRDAGRSVDGASRA